MRFRMAMIGGGRGSFIGPVHRMAATLDNECELVAIAPSSDPQNALESGKAIGLPAERVYSDWRIMIEKESSLPSDIRPHFICIATPNYLHFPQASEALEAGFHVVCDKPLCTSLADAEKLEAIVARTGKIFCLTHNYTGYPMVKLARNLIRENMLGYVRKVTIEYLQGWLGADALAEGNRQAVWRADPAKAGIAGTMADIGTHAFNIAEYISCLRITDVCADLTATLYNRKLDDDGNVLLRLEGGVKGSLLASQIATGEENNLKIRVYAEKGSIAWEQMNPNDLIVRWSDKPYQVYRTATSFGPEGKRNMAWSRLPSGHPEGFIEAFANIYRAFFNSLKQLQSNETTVYDFPDITEGVRGMKFLEAVVNSSARDCRWVSL